jgi:glucokinase
MDDCLVADIGGTHSRLALAAGGIHSIRVFDNAGFSGLEGVIDAYLQGVDAAARPATAAVAVACPVSGDELTLTNLGWTVSVEALRKRFGFRALHVFNDFAAAALAIPGLGPGDVLAVGGGTALAERPVALIGPGTGLGVAALVPCGRGWVPVASEGGHVTLAAVTEEEERIIGALRRRLGHVSAERLLSGPGLLLLYQSMAGTDKISLTPEAITRLAVSGDDPVAVRVMGHFLALLGTVAGNLALTLGAQGGVYLAGGILPGLAAQLQASSFRERFMDKGRYRDYLNAIPTLLITKEHPALVGLAAWLQAQPGEAE